MARLVPLLVAAACLAGAVRVGAGDDLAKVEIVAGAQVELCGTVVLCPASGVFCDDPTVARPESTERGIALRGLRPGATLCSAQAANLARRPFRVIVTPPPKAK